MLDSATPFTDPRDSAAASQPAQSSDTVASDGALSPRTFVGIGFGPIQAGLFLYEASVSGNFTRLVATEIQPDIVAALRASKGMYTLNIAHPNHVETVSVGPIDLYNTNDADDRAHLIDAIAQASEIATALPSVTNFVSEQPGSVDKMLAQGLLRKLEIGGPPVLIYTGENNIRAAEHLKEAITNALPAAQRTQALAQISIVNTVIGKMSGNAPAPNANAPATNFIKAMTPGFPRAILVEAYNHILISRVQFPNAGSHAGREHTFQRGIERFVEKDNLLPFEEAKLYAINAQHAFAAYLGKIAGCTSMAQLVTVPGLLPLVRAAVVEEAGTALVRKYTGLDDFFTAKNMAAYIDDFMLRMVNPALNDAIERVCRDPHRKLAWDDRLIGAMRLALAYGITPHRFALGAAAALKDLVPDADGYPHGVLIQLWARPQEDAETVHTLDDLIASRWPDLAAFAGADSNTPRAPREDTVTAQTEAGTHAGTNAAKRATDNRQAREIADSDDPSNTGSASTKTSRPQDRSTRPLTYSSSQQDE